MDDGSNGEFALVFSGSGYPDLTQFASAPGTVAMGQLYRFYLVSENHVGLSTAASDIAAYRACQAPGDLDPPERVSTSQTAVTLVWSPPGDDGGCTITSYALFMGDEATATAVGIVYSEVHSSEIRDRPSLNTFTVTALPSVAVGTTLRFKLAAFNQGGFGATSDRSLRVVLASTPTQPTDAAASDTSVTSGSVLKVTYLPPPSDGGSPVTNYEVQMDDGVGGGFHTVAGGEGTSYLRHYFIAHGGGACSYTEACDLALTSYGLDGMQYSQTVTSMALVKGMTYRLRYRAANVIGWSSWSPIGHV